MQVWEPDLKLWEPPQTGATAALFSSLPWRAEILRCERRGHVACFLLCHVAMKVFLANHVEVPAEVCPRCFNEQQRFAFPFVIYCAHREKLCVMSTPKDHVAFDCEPGQLPVVMRRLERELKGQRPWAAPRIVERELEG
jgi:hypothetical protein